MEPSDNFKNIKREFFSLRNGVIADSLRKLYPPKTIIYGLNVPQFMEMSKRYPQNIDLGLELWEDANCRDSRLFSFYILSPTEINKDLAKEMIKNVRSIEEAEFLAFRILRHLPFSQEFLKELLQEKIEDPIISYCVSMFKKNLDQI